MLIGSTISDKLNQKYAFHWDVERINYPCTDIAKNLNNLH